MQITSIKFLTYDIEISMFTSKNIAVTFFCHSLIIDQKYVYIHYKSDYIYLFIIRRYICNNNVINHGTKL